MHASSLLATYNQPIGTKPGDERGILEREAMQPTICTHCRQQVTISPEATRCPRCGEDLTHELTSETISQYYYERAATLAEAEQWEDALAETQAGLRAVRTSELLLLTAILAQRLGRFDLMRQSISQIPVGDLLREEGEWLLRSHQARQRMQREQAQLLRTGTGDTAPLSTDEFSAMGTPAPLPTDREGPIRIVPAAVAVLLIIVAAWGTWNWVGSTRTALDQSTAEGPGSESSAGTTGGATATPVFQALPPTTAPAAGTAAETPASNAAQGADPLTAGESESPELPASTPDSALDNTPSENVPENVPVDVPENVPDNVPENVPENVPDNVVEQSDPSQSIAASGAASAVSIAETKPFDILEFLRNAGRPDLAELSIDAQLQDGTLVIFGVVPWASQRIDILQLAETIENVDDTNSVNLVVRLPETYTVQEGDTLWLIAYRLYAQPERWRDIQNANAALLPSPESLRTNMQLTVPPLN